MYGILTFHGKLSSVCCMLKVLKGQSMFKLICLHSHLLICFMFHKKESSNVFLIYLLNIINPTNKKSSGKIVDKQR